MRRFLVRQSRCASKISNLEDIAAKEFELFSAEFSELYPLVWQAEKAKILADEKPLVDELCAYRDVLCLADHRH